MQTYRADTITLRCDKPDFIINEGSIWDGQYFYDLYEQAYTPWEWHEELFHVAKEEGLICFSSPFDKTAVDMLEALDCPVYKIASFEITDIPLIEYAASKHKPMVLATGIATEEDIQLAVEACRRMGNNDITVLKCTSSYPAPVEEANLCMIRDFGRTFPGKKWTFRPYPGECLSHCGGYSRCEYDRKALYFESFHRWSGLFFFYGRERFLPKW